MIRRLLPLALLLLAPRPALATGMQGHIYMAQCGAEISTNPRVKKAFEAHPLRLANGGFFPDSGYASPDHDQGEIAHWEQYIQGYIELMRERYTSLDDDEAQAALAFVMGAAAHGITDSTFDTLFFPRVEQLDPKGKDDIDLGQDVLLDVLLGRKFVPKLDLDAQFASDVFTQKIPRDVTPAEITAAMTKARSGIGATTLLAKKPDFYLETFPWSYQALLDPRTPGGYPFGARVVARYYDEILRRLDGDTSADSCVIGTYPSADYPLVTLRRDRPEATLVVYFGVGIDREKLTDALEVTGPDGAKVPAQVSTFRGDQWANVLTLTPDADWPPATTFTLTLHNTFKTLDGTSPSADLTVSFTTCSPDASGDCAPPVGPPPPSICPVTDAFSAEPPEGAGGAAGAGGDGGAGGEAGASGDAGQAGAGAAGASSGGSGPSGSSGQSGGSGQTASGAGGAGGASAGASGAAGGAPGGGAGEAEGGGCAAGGGSGARWGAWVLGLALAALGRRARASKASGRR